MNHKMKLHFYIKSLRTLVVLPVALFYTNLVEFPVCMVGVELSRCLDLTRHVNHLSSESANSHVFSIPANVALPPSWPL